eukprot:6555517-Ditylum_brightwellii.AAC.1
MAEHRPSPSPMQHKFGYIRPIPAGKFPKQVHVTQEHNPRQVTTKQYSKSIKYQQRATEKFRDQNPLDYTNKLINKGILNLEAIELIDAEISRILIETEEELPPLPVFW